jgi:hypothetical protein
MIPIVLYTASIPTASAIRPANHGVDPGLPGNELSLQACQHLLSFRHGQTKIGNVAEIIGTVDMHDVGPLLLTVSSGFHQPYRPNHTSTPDQRPDAKMPLWRAWCMDPPVAGGTDPA